MCAMSFLKDSISAKGLSTLSETPIDKVLQNMSSNEKARLDK